jgi:hypothetical protein
MPTKQININITNTQSFTTQISLFGGLQDPNQYSVNANTLYTWDTSLVNFGANATFTIQAKRSGAPTFNTIQGNMNGSFAGLVYGLNQLNMGMFWFEVIGSLQTIYTSSDYYDFGSLDFPV